MHTFATAKSVPKMINHPNINKYRHTEKKLSFRMCLDIDLVKGLLAAFPGSVANTQGK